MIRFHFALKNPLKVKDFDQIDYVEYDRSLTKNKAFEVQFTKWPATTLFSVGLDTCWVGQDHGGIRFDIELFGYFLNLNLYDKRHWDYENHCWEVYEEDLG
jgi:hypothetical protein